MALKSVFFDVGETLVDEERWWRVLAEQSDLQPHVLWAALGVTIERGEEHNELWRHLGIERPDEWWQALTYELDDLYPDAVPCLDALRRLGLRVGIVGNQTTALEGWAHDAALPADVISSSASLGVSKPDPAFFERIVELAECHPVEVALSATASTTTWFRPRSRGSWPCTFGAGRGAACSGHLPRHRWRSTTSPRFPRR